MAQTVSDAVATRDNSPTAMIKTYEGDFASVLPSHVKAETWVRVAQGALKKGKRGGSGRFELEEAAANNPGVFLAALLDAARLGLEPGSEQYYLTPRKVKGRLEILGIVGYQGHIELMYRAGAVATILAECVRANDRYTYRRGVDDVPVHEYPPFQPLAERGPLLGAYAYARMKDGAVSRVVELNGDDIARIKASSQGADSEYSPWVRHEEAMWLKSAVRQLQKWVPTSAEYRREVLRATAEAGRVAEQRALPPPPVEHLDAEATVVDGDVVDWPEAAQPPDAS
jgi:recombination protein RecT